MTQPMREGRVSSTESGTQWLTASRATLLVLTVAVAALADSWNRWADPIIDWGTELYVPWRVTEGDVVFRDVTHTYAPLSVWFNAMWWKVAGVSVHNLIALNGLVYLLFLWLGARLMRRITSLEATTLAGLFVVGLQSFAQYTGVGNYNFLTPYAHEVVHSLVLSLVALLMLDRVGEFGRTRDAVALGLVVGTIFLLKYEYFLAIIGALIAGASSLALLQGRSRLRPLASSLVAAPIPALGCWLLQARDLGAAQALRGTLSAYPLLFNRGLVSNEFFLDSAGVSDLDHRLSMIALWGLVQAFALAAPTVLLAEGKLPLLLLQLIAASFPAICVVGVARWVGSGTVFAPLPIYLLGAGLFLASRIFRTRNSSGHPPTTPLLFSSLVFAELLLARILLRARISDFGFSLALPGCALMFALSFDHLPSAAAATGFRKDLVRPALLGLMLAISARYAASAHIVRSLHAFEVGVGGDEMISGPAARLVSSATTVVNKYVSPNQTLTVMPEGAIVNYLTRRKSSVAFVTYTPFSVSKHGEGRMADDLRRTPPDFILLFAPSARSLSEFGCREFGRDCAPAIGSLLTREYAPAVRALDKGRLAFTLLARSVNGGTPKAMPEEIEVGGHL